MRSVSCSGPLLSTGWAWRSSPAHCPPRCSALGLRRPQCGGCGRPTQGMTPEMRVWRPEQLRAFLDHVRDDRLYAAWLLLATTGMRRGEVAGLRWVDVDLDAGRVSPRRPRVVVNYKVVVSEPKTAKGRRSLALDPATVAALREHREAPARGAAGGRAALGGLGPGVHLAGWPAAPPGALLQMVRATRPGGWPPEDSAARLAPQLRHGRHGKRSDDKTLTSGPRAPGSEGR